MFRLTIETTIAEANPPTTDQAPIATPAHAEYSERLAPSRTGNQYRQYERTNGVPSAATQHNSALVMRAQAKASAIDTQTTTKVPETKDSDSISSRMTLHEPRCKCRVVCTRVRYLAIQADLRPAPWPHAMHAVHPH